MHHTLFCSFHLMLFITYFTLSFPSVHVPYFCSYDEVAIYFPLLIWILYFSNFSEKIQEWLSGLLFRHVNFEMPRKNVKWRARVGSWVYVYTPCPVRFSYVTIGCAMWGLGGRQGGEETVVRIQGVDIVPHTRPQGCSSESLSFVCSGRAQPRECAQSPRPSGMNVISFFKQLPRSRLWVRVA